MPGNAESPKKLRPRNPRADNVDKLLTAVRRRHDAHVKKQAQLEEAFQALQAAVDEARGAGAVWQEIADATGVKARQAAELRFTTAGRDRNKKRSKSD